jgi:hypothetical protein
MATGINKDNYHYHYHHHHHDNSIQNTTKRNIMWKQKNKISFKFTCGRRETKREKFFISVMIIH